MSRIALLALLAGCSSGFNSSISDGTALADLDATQICTLQEEQYDYFDKTYSQSDACTLGAVFAAAFEVAFDPTADYTASCEAAYDECMGTEPEVEAFECYDMTVPEGCSYTIADFETCQDESTEAIQAFLKEGCTEPDANAEPLAGSSMCTALSEECGVYFL
ncbi:MAG: hypothetical protein H6734_26700 [Alphaproteobacteria bacterium]|nr:hypothetical protein [Alphaproteobacteria bacterium]